MQMVDRKLNPKDSLVSGIVVGGGNTQDESLTMGSLSTPVALLSEPTSPKGEDLFSPITVPPHEALFAPTPTGGSPHFFPVYSGVAQDIRDRAERETD